MTSKIGVCAALCLAAMGTMAGEIVHWAVPAMSDVQRLPDAEPKDGTKGGVVKIVAAKGEYEPGSFVAVADSDLGKMKLEVSDFKQVEKVGGGGERETGVVFPKANLDLKFVKVWYQNRNGWFSYFGDTGFKLCPELLLNDEDLVRVDTKKEANYARLVEADGRVHERWINPPRQLDRRYDAWPFYNDSTFEPMKANFHDAKTLQPVAFPKGEYKQFFLTAHVTKDIPAGVYKGSIAIGGGRETGDVRRGIHSVPVEIRVLDFELPGPKGYFKPELDYQVSSYNYYQWDIILAHNGGDVKLAEKQFEAIMRDHVAHNQTIHQFGGATPFCYGFKMQYEAQKRAGMCLDPYAVGALGLSGKNYAEWTTNAVRAAQKLDKVYGHHRTIVSHGDEPSSEWQRQERSKFEAYQRAGFKFRIAGNEQTYNPNGYLWDWFNCACKPTDSHLVDLWTKTLDIPVAWYAQQHVGAENPALNRRMYGMAPWLTGFTAIDNYAHHLGSWNDDRTTYKPMCFTYGTYDGVVGTLSWEGFREGVDDIRYATLMCRLAREAQKRGDIEAKKAGGKALQYLAMFDKTGDDLNTCRAEMISYIEKLRAVLAAKPQPLPEIKFATLEEKVAKAEAELKAAREAKKGVAEAAKKLAAVYTDEERFEDAIRVLEGEKLYNDAMGIYGGDYFRGTMVHLAPELREKFLLDRVTKPDCPPVYRKAAYVYLRENNPDVADTCADAFWGKNDRKDRLAAMQSLSWGLLDWSNREWVGGRRKTMLWAWRTAAKIAREEKVILAGDARAVRWALQDFCDVKDMDGLQYMTETFLATNKYSQALNYQLKMVRDLLPQTFATPEKATAAVRAFDAKNAGEIKIKDRVDQLCQVGSFASILENENLVRGIDAYRKALYKPQPKKNYVVKYSETPVTGAADWDRLSVKPEVQLLDRDFGGSMEFLVTDVATGNRGDVATGDKKKKAAPPEMQVVADENGLHFRFTIPDPNARKIELKLAGAGSFETYLGPGANTPYVCFLLTPGQRKIDTFNTMYDTEGHRMLKKGDVEKAQFDTIYYDDRLVCTLDLDWALYPARLPKDGDVWDFESARWGSAGGQCWNGMESIHGRSTWGALTFSLTEKQRLEIIRRRVFAAYATYKWENTAWRHEGCLKHWTDTETGDVKFYEEVVKPLMDSLEPYAKLMKEDISDADLLTVYEKAYPTWVDIVHVVARLRAEYLNR